MNANPRATTDLGRHAAYRTGQALTDVAELGPGPDESMTIALLGCAGAVGAAAIFVASSKAVSEGRPLDSITSEDRADAVAATMAALSVMLGDRTVDRALRSGHADA